MDAIAEARRMAGDVRDHKREQRRHRVAAKVAARALEEFCRKNAIELELVTQSEEGHGHGANRAAARA